MSLPEALRRLLSGGGGSDPNAGLWCASQNVTYSHRVDDPPQWNWCVLVCSRDASCARVLLGQRCQTTIAQ